MKKFCLLVAFSFSVINLFADFNEKFDGKKFACEFLKQLEQRPYELQEQFVTRWENFSQSNQISADEFRKNCEQYPNWAEQINTVRQAFNKVSYLTHDSCAFQDIFEQAGFQSGLQACQKGCCGDVYDEIDIANVELVRELDQFAQQWRQAHPKDQNAPAQRA